MNKRLVQRAMQKLVDQNPSRPLHQHTTITPTTTITPSTTTPRTLSQGNAALMASSAEAEEAMADLVDGDELVIGFDCTQGTQTLPAWAADNGYTVTEFERTGDAAWTITVRK